MVTPQVGDALTAWMIRAGKRGEREDFAINGGLAGGGFSEVPDLTAFSTIEEVRTIVRDSYPRCSKGKISTIVGQLWRLRSRVRPGDVVVLPLKTTSEIALGVVTGGYRYRNDRDASKRHVVSVDWRLTDVPKTAVQEDLLKSLGTAWDVCEIERNDGAGRLLQILETGRDPGVEVVEVAEARGATDSSESTFSIERLGRDRIKAFISKYFTDLVTADVVIAELVREVLDAEGFSTKETRTEPYSGITLLAGRDPQGLDSPCLIVRIAPATATVDVQTVIDLNMLKSSHDVEQVLLVAWGGVTENAHQEMRRQFFRFRVWDADGLLDAVFHNYDKLSEELRADLSLKRVWSIAED